jgi:hypothetical protein
MNEYESPAVVASFDSKALLGEALGLNCNGGSSCKY